MRSIIFFVSIIFLFALLQSCTGTRRFGTTIERDEKNPCLVNIVVQIGIAGTDADVAAVKSDLDGCFGKDCFIPCPLDSSKGCMARVTTVVKRWGSISDEEQVGFHYVQMVDNDGLPSTAYIGRANVSDNSQSCMWRRNEGAGVYCHEVLHLCGLYDKYCARLFDPVTGIVTERNCDPPPDPTGGTCCTPSADHKRCTVPCAGHETDIMGSSLAGMSCDNITNVLKEAGMNNCPPECCGSDSTFTRPPDEAYIIPGYFHYGIGKNGGFGHIGIGVGFNHYISPSVGITIEGGIYQHTEKENEIKETSQLIKITGGVSWLPVRPPPTRTGPIFSTHFLAGILHHTQRATLNGDEISKNSGTAFCLDIGAALNWRLNRSWSIRVLQADYVLSFFGENSQNNFRLSAGVVKSFGR